jgi:DNA-binding XRE family transcriptional regulator
MTEVVVCATSQDLAQAGQFAKKCLTNVELRTFDDIVRDIPLQPVLVYLTTFRLTHPDDDHVSSLLKAMKPSAANLVIYCADHVAPEQAARLGRLIGEFRPHHTEIVFGAEAAVSALHMPHHGGQVPIPGGNRLHAMRERLGLTQLEMGRAVGVSLRTIQNWEKEVNAGRGHLLRDLQELMAILSDVLPQSDIPVWLRSENDSFGGKRPIESILDGKTRDIISEFRRLQAGEPI